MFHICVYIKIYFYLYLSRSIYLYLICKYFNIYIFLYLYLYSNIKNKGVYIYIHIDLYLYLYLYHLYRSIYFCMKLSVQLALILFPILCLSNIYPPIYLSINVSIGIKRNMLLLYSWILFMYCLPWCFFCPIRFTILLWWGCAAASWQIRKLGGHCVQPPRGGSCSRF